MIQVIGLTSAPRRSAPPAVDDVTFEARPGHVTVLHGAPGAGKTTALRLILQLQPGRGTALFRGRPLHRVQHPTREVGVVLGEVHGHPGRTLRSHIRMLGAAAGVPRPRADAVLDIVGLSGISRQRIGTLSRGMDRRLALAAALIGDPYALVLDEPARGLSPREAAWLHGLLRSWAEHGKVVLTTTRHPEEAAEIADRVVTLDRGRLIADQEGAEFGRTRLRPRVAVRSPHAARLAAILADETRPGGPVEVVQESGTRIFVFGSSCAVVGETAHRHGILVHQLTDEIGDSGPLPPALERADGRPGTFATSSPALREGRLRTPDAVGQPARQLLQQADDVPQSAATGGARPETALRTPAKPDHGQPGAPPGDGGDAQERASVKPAIRQPGTPQTAAVQTAGGDPGSPAPRPPSKVVPLKDPDSVSRRTAEPPRGTPVPASANAGSPSRPDSASQRDSASRPGVATPSRPASRSGPAWPLRYEVCRAGGVWNGWLTAGIALAVSVVTAVLMAGSESISAVRLLIAWPHELPLPPAALGAGLIGALAFGQEFRYPALGYAGGPVPRRLGLLGAKLLVCTVIAAVLAVVSAALDGAALALVTGGAVGLPADWPVAIAGWTGLVVGCAWAGLVAAGLFRSTTMGVASVLAVPVLVVPVLQMLRVPAAQPLAGLPDDLRSGREPSWPAGIDHWVAGALRLGSQPVGQALALSLGVLFAAYLIVVVHGKTGPWPSSRRLPRELPTAQRR